MFQENSHHLTYFCSNIKDPSFFTKDQILLFLIDWIVLDQFKKLCLDDSNIVCFRNCFVQFIELAVDLFLRDLDRLMNKDELIGRTMT